MFQRQKSTNNSSFGTPEKYVTSDEMEKQKLKRKKAAFQIHDVLCIFESGDPDHWIRDPSIALKMLTKISFPP